MNELINIKVQNDQQLVSARDLHKTLGAKKKYSEWISQNIAGFIAGIDFTRSPESYLVKSGNGTVRKYDDFLLTIETAKQICMMSKTSKGKEVRKYFIQVETNWNNPDMIMQRALNIASSRVKLLENKNKELEDVNAKQAEKIAKDLSLIHISEPTRRS